ncbi:MAG TPA: cyanophycinase [Actinomycetota bacterium]|nr:cyanophycinase [Actinomycetota bacterium]
MSEPRRSSKLSPVHAGAGPIMLIGGAEDKLRGRQILKRFVKLAGGAEARVAVIATASEISEQALQLYEALFLELGVGSITGLRPHERAEADTSGAVSQLSDATAVFLTGGNQLRLTSIVAGTRLHHGLHLAQDRGAVIAGTSAGASALASHMMAFGQTGATPRHGNVQTAAGLGLVEGTIVDQHFEQRTRLGRLLSAIAQSPSLIGLGLDEDTCAIVHPDRSMEVIGRGSVTVVDGSHMQTDAYRLRGRRPMMVSGAMLHSIPSGYRFDLRSRTLKHAGASSPAVREASE